MITTDCVTYLRRMTIQQAGLTPTFTIADRLRKAREVAQLDQAELADEIGISRQTVSNYETGNTQPRKIVLNAWALATGVPLAWLKDGSGVDLTPTGGSPMAPKVSRHLELLPTISPVLSAPCGVLALAS